MITGKLYHFCINNQKTGDPEWELLDTIEYNQASEFTPLETPSVFSPVHRDGNYSISKSVFGKHLRIFIICDMNFHLFEIHLDFEICTFQNEILQYSDFASCAKFSALKITRYTVSLQNLYHSPRVIPYSRKFWWEKILANLASMHGGNYQNFTCHFSKH